MEKTFDKSKGKALGLISLGISLGISTMVPLVDVLFSYYGYFGAMLILSGVLTNSFLVPLLLQVKRPQKVYFHEENLTYTSYGTTGSTYFPNDVENPTQSKTNITIDMPNFSRQRSLLESVGGTVLKSAKLLLDFKFLHYCLLLFMIATSHSICYTFLPGLATEFGFSDSQATLLITLTGEAGPFLFSFRNT